jgi:hypothetical protein
VTFSDSDWTREPPRRSHLPAPQRRALMLAVSIALISVAVAFVVYGIERLLDANARAEVLQRADAAVARAAAPPPAAASAARPASAEAVAPSAPSAAELAALVQAREREQMAALEAEMRQRAREAAQEATAEAARRKERAWERWYQRPAFCSENPTAAQLVECANHHIRARKAFEERYPAGRP